ncbi:MAG: EAL domain-containing response regulator [Gammaproteobacteria bacterium]|nr:EAL domain-containing response regulator [Gammaproteobacteria bacterium]
MNNKAPRLLVVDDEDDVCEFVSFVARNIGYEVTSISDSQEFIEQYSHDLNIIIIDLTMPGMDGVELIRYLASVDSKAEIVLMSGFDLSVLYSARGLADSRGLTVKGVLEKPISIDSLERILDRRSKPRVPSSETKKISGPITADELRQAINNKELVNYYQPKIDIPSHFLTSVEALVRWQHPDKGLIMPDDFIALAEEAGLIKDLTSLVLDNALADCGGWKSKGIVIQVAVNISIKTLTDLNFPDQLQKKLIEHKLDPSQLIIEITESAFSDDISHVLDILTRIRMKGIHLSIDDFGTGYSSIQMLHRGPFDELKIDRSFVQHIQTDPNAHVIVETSIDFSKKMNIKSVAEGVETQEIWNSVEKLGCDVAQGYFISPAITAVEIPLWLVAWKQKQLLHCCA